MDPEHLANLIKDEGVIIRSASPHEVAPFHWYAVKSGRVVGLYKRPEEATIMVTRFPCNQSAKFPSFDRAAAFVYGEDWSETADVFVHWGPAGPPPPPIPDVDDVEGALQADLAELVLDLDDEEEEEADELEDDNQETEVADPAGGAEELAEEAS